MNKEIKFYDFNKDIYFITEYISNSSIKDYKVFLNKNNIDLNEVSFLNDFKIIDINLSIEYINNIIIIIPLNLFNTKSVLPKTMSNKNNVIVTNGENGNINYNDTNDNHTNTNTNDTNDTNDTNYNDKIDIDNITSKYLQLLQKYPDLISFIIVLKTDIIDYITLYLKKYHKNNIYNIIRNNQKEIIEMLEKNNTFINFYIRTCNINVLQNIINYNSNNIIISQIENIFPDVPVDNIEELIDIFAN